MLSKGSRYGLRAILYLALNTDKEHLLGVKELALNTEISEPMLSKTLQFLKRNALIESKKGRNGGFYMTDSQKSTDLMHVIRALEQSERIINDCLLGQKHKHPCTDCPYSDLVSSIRTSLASIYSKDTIEETALKLKQNPNNK